MIDPIYGEVYGNFHQKICWILQKIFSEIVEGSLKKCRNKNSNVTIKFEDFSNMILILFYFSIHFGPLKKFATFFLQTTIYFYVNPNKVKLFHVPFLFLFLYLIIRTNK